MNLNRLRKLFHRKQNQNNKNTGEISRFEIFKSLAPLELEIIERSVYRRRFKPGERIVNEGDASVCLYLLNSGEVKVYKTIKNEQIELATLSAGSFFGELALLKERNRSASVIAVENTEVLCLFRPDFLDILKHHPSICAKFLPRFCKTILERINRMHEQIHKLQHGS